MGSLCVCVCTISLWFVTPNSHALLVPIAAFQPLFCLFVFVCIWNANKKKKEKREEWTEINVKQKIEQSMALSHRVVSAHLIVTFVRCERFLSRTMAKQRRPRVSGGGGGRIMPHRTADTNVYLVDFPIQRSTFIFGACRLFSNQPPHTSGSCVLWVLTSTCHSHYQIYMVY